MKNFLWALVLSLCFFTPLKGQESSSPPQVRDRILTQVRLVLNWVPEPEFGGFYAAQALGLFEKEGLKVDILPGGAGSPTVQMLGAGKVEFAVTSGAELLIARSRGSEVVAIYSVFDTSPMGIMAHRSLNAKNLGDLLQKSDLTLALQKGQAYVDFLQKKFNLSTVSVVPFTGGIASFLREPRFTQQGFIFSEPLLAQKEGVAVDFFLLASVGYDPYTEVVAVQEEWMKKNLNIVAAFAKATREGWKAYLKDPMPANQVMAELNKAMDLNLFNQAAKAQASLIETETAKKNGLGHMTTERWNQHLQQLIEAGSIEAPRRPKVEEAFVNLHEETKK